METQPAQPNTQKATLKQNSTASAKSIFVIIGVLAIGFIFGFATKTVINPQQAANAPVTAKPSFDESKLPISLSLLTNPIIDEWRGGLKGKVTKKDEHTFTLEDDTGNSIVITDLMASGDQWKTTVFEKNNRFKQASFSAIQVGNTVSGDFFIFKGGPNTPVGSVFVKHQQCFMRKVNFFFPVFLLPVLSFFTFSFLIITPNRVSAVDCDPNSADPDAACYFQDTWNFCCTNSSGGTGSCNYEYYGTCGSDVEGAFDPYLCAFTSPGTISHDYTCAYGCGSSGYCNPAPANCSNPYGANGATRYDCSPATAASCNTDACVGYPMRCDNGTWVNINTAGECTTSCNNCTHTTPNPSCVYNPWGGWTDSSCCGVGLRGEIRTRTVASGTNCTATTETQCVKPDSSCSSGSGYCGDRSCNNGESCSTCQEDCGQCPSNGTAPNPVVSCNPNATGDSNRFLISWTNNANPVTYADIAPPNGFSSNNFYNKYVGGSTSTTAPVGFNDHLNGSPLTLAANTTYYVRLFNGVAHSSVLGTLNSSSCPYTPPTCTIQGYKVLTPGNQNVAPASTQTVTRVGADGTVSTSAQPYYFSNIPAGSHTVSVPTLSGYNIGYTTCTNGANCSSLTSGTSVTVNCPSGGYIDLWWYYTPTDNSEFVTHTCPPLTMTAGSSTNVSVTMKNTGTTTWTNAAGYKLGSQNPQDNTTWGLSRILINPATSVTPNANYTFNFNATAPNTAGTYNFQWRMLRERVAWFGQPSATCQTTITPAAPNANTLWAYCPAGSPVTATYYWDQVAGADSYKLTINGTPITILNSQLTDPANPFYSLAASSGAIYTWSVQACINNGADCGAAVTASPPLTCAAATTPWIQVTGDIHSNTRIYAPGGP